MKTHLFRYKKTALAVFSFFLLLISLNASAQKSVYDVIPGSGPKKPKTTIILPGVIRGDDRRNNDRVYTRRRSNLPPGQAKKIYGGSARDYAPGQVKKRERHNDEHWGRDNEEHRGRGNEGRKHGKHNDN